MRLRIPIAIGLGGAVLVAAVSVAMHMPAGDALRLAAIAGGGALAVGVVGVLLLVALRRQSLSVQITVVALASVATVGVGAAAAAKAMFISVHDLDTLVVMLLAAGTMGAIVALLLGEQVSASGRQMGALARSIAEGEAPKQLDTPRTAELASLGHELQDMSRKLEQARARERALDASRRELIAWVSHDLRTPLAGMRAMAEALEDGVVQDPETVERYYRSLRVETERLARLVDELFELSVIHAGALRLQMEKVSLSDLVSDAMSAATPSASARGVRLEGQATGPPPTLELAPPQVSRVLRNLLDNAIRHTPSDGSVWVETGVRDGGAYVSVADECGGIAESELARVFDTAFRGEVARTPAETGGAGLGLAIARGIVEAHHGEISVRNEGPGCRFTVRLPLFQRDDVPVTEPSAT
jgi:signal transduction histidine kinase